MTGVSVIIPTYNGNKLLAENLPYVVKECAAYGGAAEILVVDDAGAEAASDLLRGMFPGVKLIRNDRNEGFARSVNRAVKLAEHPLVFLLNNDIRITPGAIARMSECFKARDVFAVQARIVSGPADGEKGHLGVFSRVRGVFKYSYSRMETLREDPAEMDFASGGASMFDRGKFLALGLFDERFSPFYFEDIDLSFRARWFGWRILYRPSAVVYHLHPGSTVRAAYSKARYEAIHKKNYFLFMLKNTVGFGGIPAFFAYAAYRVLKGGFSEATALFSAVRDLAAPVAGAGPRGNILYLDSPLTYPGGGQISLLGILGTLKGYSPFVVLSGPSLLSEELGREGLPLRVMRAGKRDLFGFAREALWTLGAVKPRLVHCNSGTTFFTFVFALAAKARGIPFLWHNRVLDTAGLKEKAIAALSSRVIVISDAVAKKFAWMPAGRVLKLENAVDTEVFRPREVSRELYGELGLAGEARVVGVFSRLEKWKGHEMFLAAAEKALAKHPDCEVLIVGEGSERERLQALAAGLRIGGRVRFAGHRKDIPQLMNLCSVIVNPSVEPEPFGRTIIEGMACGKAVIATAMGGPLEIIDDGVDGFLTAPDVVPMAAAISALLDDPELAGRAGLAARDKALKRFDLRSQAARLGRIYGEL